MSNYQNSHYEEYTPKISGHTTRQNNIKLIEIKVIKETFLCCNISHRGN